MVPFAVVLFVFWWKGGLDEYFFANFGFNLAYTALYVDKGVLARAALSRQATQGNLVLVALSFRGGCWAL